MAGAEPMLGDRLARLAYQSLLREVMLTPKPGLVDRRNGGSHRDMDLSTFHASARAIAPWLARFFTIGLADCDLPAGLFLLRIRPDGLACEQAMPHAAGGATPTRAASSPSGCCAPPPGESPGGARPSLPAPCVPRWPRSAPAWSMNCGEGGEATTAGEYLFRRHGLTGARGEAASGFATVRAYALPMFERLRTAGSGADIALHGALMELLAFNPDTNVVARGGLGGLPFLQGETMRLRRAGGVGAPGRRAS